MRKTGWLMTRSMMGLLALAHPSLGAEYRLLFNQAGPGGFGAGGQMAVTQALLSASSAVFEVVPVAHAGGAMFSHWLGDTNGLALSASNTLQGTMDSDHRTLTAVFGRELTVASAHGAPWPAVGTASVPVMERMLAGETYRRNLTSTKYDQAWQIIMNGEIGYYFRLPDLDR